MKIYADNAASTPVSQEVFKAMQESYEHYGNPSCNNAMGQKSRELIETARNQIAQHIGAQPNEIIFTSGGTESNNLAILGYVYANRGNHIITTDIEHMSVLNPISELYHNGYNITYLPVDNEGKINPKHLKQAIRSNTVLISIMFANNEIGTIQPIKDIGDIARLYNIPFHTDAIQAIGHLEIDVKKLGISMMSISGHKIYAPKGVGALYVKNGIRLYPIVYGSGQEYGLRSGTENVNSIVALGKAVELLNGIEPSKLCLLKNKLVNGIISNISDSQLNGSMENGLCSISNFSFYGVDGERLLNMLNEIGIYASRGSACSTSISGHSHVLRAIGVTDELSYSSVRFSLGKYNSESDVDYIISVLPELIDNLRK